MIKAILLTGEPQTGKTFLIKRILSHLSCQTGGFYTEEIRDKGKRVGFQMVTLDGRQAVLAHTSLDSPFRVGRYGVDMSVLDSIGVDCLMKAVNNKRLIAIDEIGPMEILSDKFRDAILDLLARDVLIFGAIVNRSTPFTDIIKSRVDVIVVEVHKGNQETVFEYVLQLIGKYVTTM